jgi:hypothetical protein
MPAVVCGECEEADATQLARNAFVETRVQRLNDRCSVCLSIPIPRHGIETTWKGDHGQTLQWRRPSDAIYHGTVLHALAMSAIFGPGRLLVLEVMLKPH